MSIVRIEGKIQHYDWGGKSFIPSIFGIEESSTPCAEYWMGTHPNGMSELSNSNISLEQYIHSNPIEKLGKDTAKEFKNKLPYLFKVLDVASMLSIQVHPTKKEAELGFAAENESGIALNAPNRNFKDDNHKPEIMVALSDFWLLHGFKSVDQIDEILNNYPSFHSLIEYFKDKNIKKLYQYIMEMDQELVNQILLPLHENLTNQPPMDKANPDYWALKAFEQYTIKGNFDRGIFSIYLMNLVKIDPGGAIFQGAGIPHAYLEGQNMELMANSDNVFRGGLTPKYIDVPMLLKHTLFESVDPKILNGSVSNHERIYKTECSDFEISCISLNKGESYHQEMSKGPSIIFVLNGSGELKENNLNILNFEHGSTFYIDNSTQYSIIAIENIVIYKAGMPN